MPNYLISFPGEAMQVPAEEMAAVGAAAGAVVEDARAAGVLLYAGGILDEVGPVLVAADGSVREGAYPQSRELSGGFTVLDLPSREEAYAWAARIAAACRCEQEVREIV